MAGTQEVIEMIVIPLHSILHDIEKDHIRIEETIQDTELVKHLCRFNVTIGRVCGNGEGFLIRNSDDF